MDQIIINDFSQGWIPSDNAVNGRKNGLLQMDNLELDENGALIMIGGCSVKHTGFTYDAHTLYSRVISGARKDYNADVNGGIFRNTTSIGTGGSTSRAAFGDAFNYVLACSGNTRKKDDGTSAVNLGILPATVAPTVVVNAANAPYEVIGTVTSDVVTPAAFGTSTNVSTYRQLTANTDGIGVLQTYDSTPAAFNCNLLNGVGGASNIGYATDNDFIIVAGYLVDPFGKSLQFDVVLVAGNSSGDIVSDYYTYLVTDIAQEASFNTDGSFYIKIRRSQFTRIGNSAADWTTVFGFRITFVGTNGEIINLLGNGVGSPTHYIIGGSKSQDGQYQYMQLNVNNTGSYIAKSAIGVMSNPKNIDMMQALITPQDPTGVDAQCNEAWIFRRGGLLQQWYRVKVFTTAGTYAAAYDTLSDIDAIKLNIIYNENLSSIASSSISDAILGIVGPIEGRWLYFTNNYMYPSDINNPDLVDVGRTVKITGSTSEKFMWACKVGDKQVLVGTTVDIYILAGTFITQPDFTIDLYYDGVGCEYAPICQDAAESDNSVFYLAKDGWRVANSSGATRLLVAPNTDLLYDGQTRYTYGPPTLTVGSRFPVVIGKNKLWCFITGTNRCEVYDFTRQYWRTFNYGLGDVTASFSTQDGFILAFYGTDNKIREVDISTSKLIDAATKQTITLLTLVHDNQTPKQRKDSSTLGLRVYTGSDNLTAKLTLQDNVTTNISTAINNATFLESNYDLSAISAVAIGKTYQLTLTGQLADFRFTDATIIFSTRPLPVNFVRVQSNNYGTIARKRVYSVPLQIDTLGNTVILTPYVDNASQTTMNLVSAYKASFNYKFLLSGTDVSVKGRDYEYTLQCTTGLFEFFGFEEPRGIEVFPDPTRSYVIPVTNYGTTSRKRLKLLRFILDPLSTTVTFTPYIDGIAQTVSTFTTAGKRTCFHYFTTDQIGVDFSGTFSASGDFELWQILEPQQDDIEVFPDSNKFAVIPVTNYGSTSRKRLRVIRFVLDCKSATVTFTPIIDTVSQTSQAYSGSGKKTYYYYYKSDMIGVDFSGTFSGTDIFELWQVLTPEDGDFEKFPEQVKYLVVPATNFGSANKKRVRVLPFEINTRGADVTFAPLVDGESYLPVTTFNTDDFETVRHQFASDVFGVWYSGIFSGDSEFELRSTMPPDVVQVLPIARRFDQVGPYELFQYGKIKQIEIRILPFGPDETNDIPFLIYFNDNTSYENVFTVVNGKEASYFVGVPKTRAGNIVRIEIGPVSYDFHRFYMRAQLDRVGKDTEMEWITLGEPK